MKTKEIFKANGITFNTLDEVSNYAKENNYRITNSTVLNTKKRIVVLIDLASKLLLWIKIF